MMDRLNQASIKITLITVVGHLLLLTVAYLVCARFFYTIELPDSYTLITWDADWYDSIRKSGYVFVPDTQCNMAFFPLFPLLWGFLKIDASLISLLNAILFTSSFVVLLGRKKKNFFYLLAVISIPSFVFFFVPYSESLFFLFGTVCLLGYESSNKWMIFIGLVGACLTRSVAIIFIPALIITQFICSDWNRKNLTNLIIFILAPLCSILVVVFMQYIDTGKWFYFIEVQKYWNRHLHVPVLPFEILSTKRIARFDATALLIGLTAAYFCVEWMIVSVTAKYHHKPNPISTAPAVIFSALYLAGATFINLFFSFELDSGTILMSLNRYIFATPFFIYFIWWLATEYTFAKHVPYILIAIAIATFLCTALWEQSISAIGYYIAFVILYLLNNLLKKNSAPVCVMVYLVNITFQIMLFNDLLHKKWVG